MAAKQDGLWLRLFVIVWHTTWQHAYLYDWRWNKRVPTRPDLSLFRWDALCRAPYSLRATDEKPQRCTGATMSLWKLSEDFPVFFLVFFWGGSSFFIDLSWFIVSHHRFKWTKRCHWCSCDVECVGFMMIRAEQVCDVREGWKIINLSLTKMEDIGYRSSAKEWVKRGRKF